ncbi:DUF4279 domain-containing protein [Mucilaginibacter gilvus]|uniref:DUF4279 domain-containing protein n=1 Tax=Mucilaginibacter gilvus TaxID=2305909 RepID=A0A3S4Y7S4_9SPHI|nr:DUF4279 domain-containing protein [Mucilaginibacter gilvus]RWY49237.1 DUF4279 domain-containing protein [Mucilaginibacter gilvus]
MKKKKVDLLFKIVDFEDITHDDITTMLGIAPAHTAVKGDKRNPNNPDSPLKTNNSWSMSSGLDEYADFEAQMNALLDIIEQKEDAFKLLCDKYYCEFACAIFTYRDNDESTPWVHLDKRYNKLIKELDIEFDIDLYVF